MNATKNYEPRQDLAETPPPPVYGDPVKYWPTFCVRCFRPGPWQTDGVPRKCPRCGFLLKVGT